MVHKFSSSSWTIVKKCIWSLVHCLVGNLRRPSPKNVKNPSTPSGSFLFRRVDKMISSNSSFSFSLFIFCSKIIFLWKTKWNYSLNNDIVLSNILLFLSNPEVLSFDSLLLIGGDTNVMDGLFCRNPSEIPLDPELFIGVETKVMTFCSDPAEVLIGTFGHSFCCKTVARLVHVLKFKKKI